jgi:hypothetical protein
MSRVRTRIVGGAVVVVVLVSGLTGCFPDADPGTVASVRSSIVSFEERLDEILRGARSPETVSRDLGPSTSSVSDASLSGQILASEIDADTVTVDVIFRAQSFVGGGWMSDTADKYLCLAYAIDPHEGTYTRAASDCPGAPNKVAELITLDELDLEPPGQNETSSPPS